MKQEPVALNVGGQPIDQQLGFISQAIVVDNYSNQWVFIPGITQFVPPYTIRATYITNGTQRAQAQFLAPSGITQPPSVAGQQAICAWYDSQLPPNGGFSITGNRAPYFDRNPLSITRSFQSNVVGPAANLLGWTYTVPAGRKAYLESYYLNVELNVAGGPPGANLKQALLRYIPVIGTPINFQSADYYVPNALGTKVVTAGGSSVIMLAGDAIEGRYTVPNGADIYIVNTAKLTEFDE